jgi:hypothetical protein
MGPPWKRLLCALLLAGFPAAPALGLTVEPNPLTVGARFDGGTVRIRGSADPESQVFVIISGTHIKEKFNRKGRVGPVWVNVGTVQVSGVPRLCLIASSGPGSAGLDRQLVDRHFLDLEAVSRLAILDPPGSDGESVRREYIKLKQSQGVLSSLPGAVRIGTEEGRGEFTVAIPWPVSGGAGTYSVDVVQVKAGTLLRKETATIEVRLVGLPRWISFLAFERSRLYGVFSVVSAICVGLLMGLVFKKGGGH